MDANGDKAVEITRVKLSDFVDTLKKATDGHNEALERIEQTGGGRCVAANDNGPVYYAPEDDFLFEDARG